MLIESTEAVTDLLSDPAARRRLVHVATAILPGDEAEDAAHDGVVQALKALPGYRGDARASTWMHRIVVNAALMRRRRARRARAHAEAEALAKAEARNRVAHDDPTFDRRLHASAIRRSLARLPRAYRIAIERCLLKEEPMAAVAADLGLTPSGLRTRLLRARRLLRAALLSPETGQPEDRIPAAA